MFVIQKYFQLKMFELDEMTVINLCYSLRAAVLH